MATDVMTPQMGESIAEGTIVKWLKKVGDTVKRDEPLLEISTDKVDAEIPSPAAGVLLEIVGKEGDVIAVNAVIARIGETGGAEANAPAAVASSASALATSIPAPPPAPAPPQAYPPAAVTAPLTMPATTAATAVSSVAEDSVRSSPLVRNIAREHGINLAEVQG